MSKEKSKQQNHRDNPIYISGSLEGGAKMLYGHTSNFSGGFKKRKLNEGTP